MDLSGHEGEIPIPITSSYVVHKPSKRPPPPSTTNNTEAQITVSNTKKGVVRYRECLKNHAASMGGIATDGCGEFMPSGEEGTLEAFKCAACNCHRNFHRKEIEGEPSSCQEFYLNGRKGVLISRSDAFGYISRPPPPPPLIMPLGAVHTPESDDMEEGFGGIGVGGGMVRAPMVKKRFRTKFTQEQKEKMMDFAKKVGWRLQRQEEGLLQQLCQEIGVKRRVLKVWMHNNKHNLAKKSTLQLQ